MGNSLSSSNQHNNNGNNNNNNRKSQVQGRYPYIYKSNLEELRDLTQMKKNGVTLLIIDPQNDFCDPKGSLYVPGANKDMEELSTYIKKYWNKIHNIVVTLDTHQKFHIAHPMFWVNANGKHPEPFTKITYQQVVEGEWRTSNPQKQLEALNYCKKLETTIKSGSEKFVLCVWPEHCLFGSVGYAIYSELYESLKYWEHENKSAVNFVVKGHNSMTEMYSAIRAEVPIEDDPNTLTNHSLIFDLRKYKRVLIAGEAKSHCVNFSIRDIVNNWEPARFKDLILMSNAMSSVVTFESDGDKFISEMREKGLTITTLETAFSDLDKL